MENQYIISESELIDLLAAYHYANCLDAEGVDNWSWYMVNKEEYLGNFESFEDTRFLRNIFLLLLLFLGEG